MPEQLPETTTDALGDALGVSISLPLDEVTSDTARSLLRSLRQARREASDLPEGDLLQLEMLIMAADVLCCLASRLGDEALADALSRVAAEVTGARQAAGARASGRVPVALTASNLVEVAIKARLAVSSDSAARHLDHVLHPGSSGASHHKAREESKAASRASAAPGGGRTGKRPVPAVDLAHNSAHAGENFQHELRGGDKAHHSAPRRRASPARAAAAAGRFARPPSTPERARAAQAAKKGMHQPVAEQAGRYAFRKLPGSTSMSAKTSTGDAAKRAQQRRIAKEYGNRQSKSNSPLRGTRSSSPSLAASSPSLSTASDPSGVAGSVGSVGSASSVGSVGSEGEGARLSATR